MKIPDSLRPELKRERFEENRIPLDIPSQLDELRLLKDGWLDGKGLAPPGVGLDWLANAVREHYSDHLEQPYIYPVAEGGVRFEWSFGPDDVSLDIDLNQRTGEWHCLNLDSDEDEARPLDLNTKSDWDWMTERLQSLSGAGS